MFSETVWRRMLYGSIGLIAVVAVILVIMVIPPSTIPQRAVIPIWVNVIVHLLIIVALIWIIQVNKRGDQRKELLVVTGALLIVLSIIILDGVAAYYGTPDQHGASILLLISAVCDFAAGVLALIARYFRRYLSLSK
jgi:hypothetical protein